MFSYPADLVGTGNPCAEGAREAGTLPGCSDPSSRYLGCNRGSHEVPLYFRIRAQRLPSPAANVMDVNVSHELKKTVQTTILLADLQMVNGIGGETADSLLCKGFFRTSFKVDGSSEKILRCTGLPLPRRKVLSEDVLTCDNRTERHTCALRGEYPKMFWRKKECDRCIPVNSSG